MSEKNSNEINKTIIRLEKEISKLKNLEKKYKENEKSLKRQNVKLVQKSVELSETKKELEDKNYELNYIRKELKEQNVNLVKNSIELSDLMREVEDKNYDLKISEKKLKETLNELTLSEDKYKKLVNLLPLVIFETDINGILTFINKHAFDTFGFSKEDFENGILPFNRIAFEDREKAMTDFGRVINNEKMGGVDYTAIAPDGKKLNITIYSIPIKKAGKIVGLRGFIIDNTEKKKAEEERFKLEKKLQQTQKIEAVGILAGGIAHNFNNLLMGIQGNISLLLLDMDEKSNSYKELKFIEQQIPNGAKITNQLLAFSKGGKNEVELIDIKKIFERTVYMFGSTKKEITIHESYDDDLYNVEVDQSQIEQVILNLFINSWQAMKAGGDLYVKVSNTTLSADYLKKYPSINPGDFIKIIIRDTGEGIKKENLIKIFDPFFTTKKVGKGTGLGLAYAYGIIKDHGGIIKVDSKYSEGTKFTICLPASSRKIVKNKKETEEPQKGYETILLVDDEDIIVQVGKKLMEKMGYRVLTAHCGREAIEVYKNNKNIIDLVILDMIMPDLNGAETYKLLREIDEHIKVLLSSGYDNNSETEEILKMGCNSFIKKPFTMSELLTKIRQIIKCDCN